MSGLLAPLALIGLLALPVIVAFYMLRLRRRDVPVGSTFLWQQLVRDVEANAPWQRLRFSWLLLIQLLIAALVVVRRDAGHSPTATSELAANVVLVSTPRPRWAPPTPSARGWWAARESAQVSSIGSRRSGRITVVAADDTAHVLVSETDDRSTASTAIDHVLATELARRPHRCLRARLCPCCAGRGLDGCGRLGCRPSRASQRRHRRAGPVSSGWATATRTRPSRRSRRASVRRRAARLFVAVTNLSAGDVDAAPGDLRGRVLVDARDLAVPAAQRTEAIIGTVPASAQRRGGPPGGQPMPWRSTIGRSRSCRPAPRSRTLLVSEGNAYLENALALLPRLDLYEVGAAGYEAAIAEASSAGTPYGLIVFDGTVPTDAPRVPLLFVGPHDDGPFGTLGAVLEGPAIARTDPQDPLLRYVDLANVHIGRTPAIELAEGLRPAVSTVGGCAARGGRHARGTRDRGHRLRPGR